MDKQENKGFSEKEMEKAMEESMDLARELMKLDKPTRETLKAVLEGIKIGRKND